MSPFLFLLLGLRHNMTATALTRASVAAGTRLTTIGYPLLLVASANNTTTAGGANLFLLHHDHSPPFVHNSDCNTYIVIMTTLASTQ